MITQLMRDAYSLNKQMKYNIKQCELSILYWLIKDSMATLLNIDDEQSKPEDNPSDDKKYIYFGTVPANLCEYDYSKITSDIVKTNLRRISASTLPKTGIDFQIGDMVVVAVPSGKVVTTDDGFGEKIPFYSEFTSPITGRPIYSNGNDTVVVAGVEYKLYGEFMTLPSGTLYIYVD